jgi:Fur family transcriptional regulator, ferric uptake regulator
MIAGRRVNAIANRLQETGGQGRHVVRMPAKRIPRKSGCGLPGAAFCLEIHGPRRRLSGAFATHCHLAHSRAMMNQKTHKPDYESALRKAGVRVTRPRQVILSILSQLEDHPDALEIFRRAVEIDQGISLSTVYRTMKLLEELGAIHRHAFEGGPSRFEQASDEHHDHLIDIETGDVIEFKSDRIEQLQDEIAKRLGYDIVHHRLELYGRKRRA